MRPCPICTKPTSAAICADCAVCGLLLDPAPERRLAALNAALAPDRPKVLAAMMRGWHLFAGVSVGDVNLDEAVLRWLFRHAPTVTWLRYLSEDAMWGWMAQPSVAKAERDRALLRMPEWFSRIGGRPDPVVEVWAGNSPAEIAALGLRLGACHVPESSWKGAIPWGAGWLGGVAAARGEAQPTVGQWRPEVAQLARSPRRWPLMRWEEGCPVCCGMCGEPLPAAGCCSWCGTNPESEPPMLAPLGDLFAERHVCGSCGVDQSTKLAPARCPGCGEALA